MIQVDVDVDDDDDDDDDDILKTVNIKTVDGKCL